jgi:nitrogen fixation/metabolism regulation signal transduction histidine kinase
MAYKTLERLTNSPKSLAALSALLVIALFMMNAATQNSHLFGDVYSLLLIINLLGILFLLALILVNIYRLVVQFREGVMGSRLTLRLLSMITVLAVVPVVIVFTFSIHAINRGIDSWFDVKVERALDGALLLGRLTLDAKKQELLSKTKEIATQLQKTSGHLAISALSILRDQNDIAELTLFSEDGKIIATAGQESDILVPDQPDEAVMSQIRKGLSYVGLDAISENDLRIRVVVPVYSDDINALPRVLQALQPLPNRYATLGENVQSSYAEYEKLIYLRGPLKFGFTLSLSLIALITVLISIWASIFASRRVLAPLRDLAEGTAAVANGNYRKQLPVSSRDELGILVKSFNDMTDRIRKAQQQTRRSQREAESQRAYLETVLAHLSSGVLSIDAKHRMQGLNSAASVLLAIDLNKAQQKTLKEMSGIEPRLEPFFSSIEESLAGEELEWQSEVSLREEPGRKILLLRGSRLPGSQREYIVVFDDVTAIIQSQRDAAWSEVARRLAHEIKNPLTPIQLSAERIRHKLMPDLEEGAKQTLDRSTRTIVEQVDSLKEMINAFSSYARPVKIHFEQVNLNELIRDVVELYKSQTRSKVKIDIQLELDPDLPDIRADSGRLRQVLHNLLLNCQDALVKTTDPKIFIRTRPGTKSAVGTIEMVVADNGPGFPKSLMDNIFEPYVTNKEKGTGLGLAIVKKIAEEHNGTLVAANRKQGAEIRVILPVQSRSDTPADDQRDIQERRA